MLTEKTPRPSSMSMAFYIALLNQPQRRGKTALVRKVESSISRNVGLVREREVNAKVSYRTAQKLKHQGVL